jgi:Domain of unknown function (DUF1824)
MAIRDLASMMVFFWANLLTIGHCFLLPSSTRVPSTPYRNPFITPLFRSTKEDTTTSSSSSIVMTIQQATQILNDWDQHFNRENISGNSLPDDIEQYREVLPVALKVLNEAARQERTKDSTMGRVMLGICASSLEEGIATLKSWVTGLSLPRGLLHGADKEGVQLELKGGVYIKVRLN